MSKTEKPKLLWIGNFCLTKLAVGLIFSTLFSCPFILVLLLFGNSLEMSILMILPLFALVSLFGFLYVFSEMLLRDIGFITRERE